MQQPIQGLSSMNQAMQGIQGVQGVQASGFTPSRHTFQYNPQPRGIRSVGINTSFNNQANPTSVQTITNPNTDSYLKQLANVESQGKYDAYNKGSGAYGKYQFIPSTEQAYMKKLGYTQAQARTPEGQEAMIRRLTADNRAGLIKAGYKPTNMNLWLAHNQGLGGAKAILSGGNVNMHNIRSNIPKGKGTVQDYLNYWGSRFGGSNQTYAPPTNPTVNKVTTYKPSIPIEAGLTQTDYDELDSIMREYGLDTRG